MNTASISTKKLAAITWRGAGQYNYTLNSAYVGYEHYATVDADATHINRNTFFTREELEYAVLYPTLHEARFRANYYTARENVAAPMLHSATARADINEMLKEGRAS